jgi:alcohol dehydrogenase class IV
LGKASASLGRKVMLICGSSARRPGALDKALASLEQAGEEVLVRDTVSGEPTLALVAAEVEQARAWGAQVLVGLGGGSAIDVAKATAGLAPLQGEPREYFAGRGLDGPALPWIGVPTTSGTGAEVTMNAVLIDEQACLKKSIRGEDWFARYAIVDPLLTLSAPPRVTAQSGADALVQAIEPFTSIAAMPVTDALCRDAIRLIGRSLLPAYQNGADLAARRDLAYGSLMAGMALTNARLGAVHGMAHPLGCRYQLPHGLICGLLLPYVMEYNLPVCAGRYAEVAALLGLEVAGLSESDAAWAAIGRVRRLMRDIGIPERLSQAGVERIDYEAVAHESMSASLKHNARPLSEADVVELLKRAF